jgi:hypothetical protein
LVADLRQENVTDFINRLGPAFYADDEMIQDAINRRACFNSIHKPTMFQVDVFIPKRRDFDREDLVIRSRRDALSAYFREAIEKAGNKRGALFISCAARQRQLCWIRGQISERSRNSRAIPE